MYTLLALNTFIMECEPSLLWQEHWNVLISEHFHYLPPKSLYPLGNHSSFPRSLNPSKNTYLLSSSMNLCFLDISYLESTCFFVSGFFHLQCFQGSSMLFSLYGWMIFHCMDTFLLAHSSADGHLGCLAFWLFWIKLLWTTRFLKWTKDLNIHFFKNDEEITNKHMKRYSTSLVIRQTQIRITIRYHFTLPIH